MTKLLTANFFSMVRAKRFWLGAGIIIGAALMDVVSNARSMLAQDSVNLDDILVSCVPWQFILLPCLCGLFINTDYHDGTIRNKLTVGCSRKMVYLSNFIILYAVELFYMVLALSTILLAGVGIPVANPQNVAMRICLLLLALLALTAIAVFLATMVTNRSALVVCALVGLGMMFGGQMINSMLESPREIADYGGVMYTTDEKGRQTMQYLDREGNPIKVEDIPMIQNPNYIDEPMRTVLRTFNDFQPGGQLWEILWDGHREYNDDGSDLVMVQTPRWQLALYSSLVTLAFTALGLTFFQRKDLK